jgi:hypothetical protein
MKITPKDVGKALQDLNFLSKFPKGIQDKVMENWSENDKRKCKPCKKTSSLSIIFYKEVYKEFKELFQEYYETKL